MKSKIYQNNKEISMPFERFILRSALWVVIFFFGSIATELRAQDALKQIIPPSPEASAIAKYGEYPVSLHTGVPNISIPLTVLSGKSLSVPADLSYHASGIRVDEVASWVGLGWNLNIGGVITRTVRGQHDDYGGSGFFYATPKHSNDITFDQTGYEYLRLASEGDKDTESDYYFYNFNGRSGKFILDDNKEAFLIPKSGIQVDLSNFPLSITIVDELGVNYKFEERETLDVTIYSDQFPGENVSYTSAWYLTEIIAADQSDTIEFSYTKDISYVENTFSHREAIGEKIGINEITGIPYISDHQHDISVPSSQTARQITATRLESIVSSNGKIEVLKAGGRSDLPDSRLTNIKVYHTATANQDYQLVKEFLFQNNAYFSNNGWEVVDAADPLQHRLKLEALVEMDALGNIVKRHRFDYNERVPLPPKGNYAQDHWGYYNGRNTNGSLIPRQVTGWIGHIYNVGQADRSPDEYYTKAYILEKIHFPTGGYTEFSYEGNQYSTTAQVEQSATASAAEMNNTAALLTETTFITPTKSGWARLSTTCSNVTDVDPFFSTITLKDQLGGNYLVNHIYSPASFSGPYDGEFLLTYDVYITAGRTYELVAQAKGNSDSQAFGGAAYALATLTWQQNGPAGVFAKAGGLRVASIKSYASQNANPVIRTYKYGIGENGAGLLLMPNDDLSLYEEEKMESLGYHNPNQSVQCIYYYADRKFFYGNTLYDLTTLSGSPVVYPQVSEYLGDMNNHEGKIVHQFDVEQDAFMPVSSGYKNGKIQLNNSWKGGQEKYADIKKNDVSATIVQTEDNSFRIKSSASVNSFKVGGVTNHTGCRVPTNVVNQEFYWFDYPIESGAKLLSRKVLESFPSVASAQQVSTIENFTYDDENFQLLKKELTGSDGQTHETSFKYPKHYTYAANSALDKMVDRNIIALPIEISESVNGSVVRSSATKFNHDVNSDLVLPSEYYTYETTEPGLNFTASTDGQMFTGYQREASILSRDDEGNVLEQQLENDLVTVFVWGYNRTLPVAKVTGASYAAVETVLGGSTGINNLQTQTGSTLRSTLNVLRIHASLQDAQVTTFTYEPGKGIASQTDPSGLTTFYEYDDFGRLDHIKDTDGNIVKKYEYNFKNFSN